MGGYIIMLNKCRLKFSLKLELFQTTDERNILGLVPFLKKKHIQNCWELGLKSYNLLLIVCSVLPCSSVAFTLGNLRTSVSCYAYDWLAS